jgi:NTP pyrophosphatase (non-canonical NTP hydrolase)
VTHFNDLTPQEAERLALLAEEAGELIQAIGKILRHGYESYNPDDVDAGENRVQLCKEIADIEYAVTLMLDAGDIDRGQISIYREIAEAKKPRYLHHQDYLGELRALDEEGEQANER